MMDVELNYYWGDDSFHSGERHLTVTSYNQITYLVQQYKPRHASVAYCMVYVNDEYYCTQEVL